MFDSPSQFWFFRPPAFFTTVFFMLPLCSNLLLLLLFTYILRCLFHSIQSICKCFLSFFEKEEEESPHRYISFLDIEGMIKPYLCSEYKIDKKNLWKKIKTDWMYVCSKVCSHSSSRYGCGFLSLQTQSSFLFSHCIESDFAIHQSTLFDCSFR